MQEANILMAVTGVVVLGLLVWVALVLATVKTPWARPLALAEGAPSGEPALAPKADGEALAASETSDTPSSH